jgi:uncharacterized protein YdaU (DUF1376 family)
MGHHQSWREEVTKNRWAKFFPSDFLTGIRNLNAVEVAAYIVVLCELYDHEGFALRDDSAMAGRCRMRKSEFTRGLDGLIAKRKLHFDGLQLSNSRVTEEVERRTKAAIDKARQRHDRDIAATRGQQEQRKKLNEYNGSRLNVAAYKEEDEDKKEEPTLEVSALRPRSQGFERSAESLAAFERRLAERNRRRPHSFT